MSSAPTYVHERMAGIEALLDEVERWASSDPKLGAHLAAYMSVSILGILEDCIEKLVIERAGRPGDPEVQNYITRSIEGGFRNPNYGKISEMLKNFSTDYQRAFLEKIPHSEAPCRALQSIVDNKTDLAHRGEYTLNLTVGDVRIYYSGVTRILEVLGEILG